MSCEGSLIFHLQEMRKRLLFALLFYVAAVAVCFSNVEWLLQLLLGPLARSWAGPGQCRLIFTNITDGFSNQMHIAMVFGLMLSWPALMLQLYRFVAPGLHRHEKILLRFILLLSPILFVAGSFLAYNWIMPMAWRFFMSFQQTGPIQIVLEQRVNEYTDLALELIVDFGLCFQMPLVLSALARFGLLTPEALVSKRRHAVVLIFVVAALLTPPDVLSQIALAIPMWLLYEFSILLCRFIALSHKP